MEIPRRVERRREPRLEIDLSLVIWGVDTEGERFVQEVHARDISLSGALLSGLDADLRSGDVIGKQKARYRVVWVRYDDKGDKMQAAVHRVESDACPWQDLLTEETSAGSPPEDHPSP